MKYSANKDLKPDPINKWKDFANKYKPEDLYVGGVCGLYYSLEIVDFINKQKADDFVSVFFVCDIMGNDKRQLLLTSNKIIPDEQIKSLPFNYLPNKSSQLNKTIIETYLRNMDEEFQVNNKFVTFVLNIPEEFLDGLILTNINIIYSKHLDYIITTIDRLANCLKVHYRKLQISKSTIHAKNATNVTFMEYFYLTSMAWNNVPYSYIRKLLYFGEGASNCNENKDLSLLYWCKINNIPINRDLYGSLDEYTTCDKAIRVFNLSSITEPETEDKSVPENINIDPTSAIQAYQAMKRLVNFLQSKKVDSAVMKPARNLENHLEYEALLEMHEYVKGQNDNT